MPRCKALLGLKSTSLGVCGSSAAAPQQIPQRYSPFLLDIRRKCAETGIVRMDPLSITAACGGLLSTIATLTVQITRFVGDVRESALEMSGMRRELSEVSFYVERLQDDTSQDNIPYPAALKDNLLGVLDNCNVIIVDMQTVLQKMSSGNLGRRIQWRQLGRARSPG